MAAVSALCWRCAEDLHLSDRIRADGQRRRCSECGSNRYAWTVGELANQAAEIIREHFSPGDSVKQFGENDEEWYEQKGEPLRHVVESVVGQYVSFHQELVKAIEDTEPGGKPYDVADPFFDIGTNYEANPVYLGEFSDRWKHLNEALHAAPSLYDSATKLFHPEAREFFDELLGNLDSLTGWSEDRDKPIIRELEVGFVVWQARPCETRDLVTKVIAATLDELGPPPIAIARAGRMNRAGTSVFYGAVDRETCLAEMRPSLGGETIVGKFLTMKPLRVLDFERLENAWSGFSYWDPAFPRPRERAHFVRALHDLVSQPVAAGKEAEYAITQALAEYLGRVIPKPVDGVLFKSVQHEGGVNLVLFGIPDAASRTGALFAIEVIPETLELHRTTKIEYEHEEISYVLKPGDPEPFFYTFD